MTIAEATWVATALLHKENPGAADFSVAEIKQKAKEEGLVDSSRSGLSVHVSKHCVANKSADPATHRMLFKTVSGRRRLFKKEMDEYHPDRRNGKIYPPKTDLPEQFHSLVDWYNDVYASAHRETVSAAQDISPAITLLGLLAKPLSVNSSGELVIPKDMLNDLGVKAGVSLSLRRVDDHLVLQPITENYISSLLGSLKGTDLVGAREREHRIER